MDLNKTCERRCGDDRGLGPQSISTAPRSDLNIILSATNIPILTVSDTGVLGNSCPAVLERTPPLQY